MIKEVLIKAIKSRDSMNIKFLVVVCFTISSLNAMEFDIPTLRDTQEQDEATQKYRQQLLINYEKHFRYPLQINYANENPEDDKSAIIKRFVETVVERAFVIRNPDLEKHFKKLHKNSQALDISWNPLAYKLRGSLAVKKDADEALRSVLADRSLITYILRGTTDQPWITRPEFDQEWSAIRKDIKEEEIANRNAVSEKVQRIERDNVNSLDRNKQMDYSWIGPRTAAAIIRNGCIPALY